MDNKTSQIKNYEIIDHGIKNPDYFMGCGTTHTQYENVVTGIGNNASEAFDDCLEQISSMCDFDYIDTNGIIFGADEVDNENSFYYMSIRFNVSF